MEDKFTILHVLFVSNNRTSGVRNVVPKHLEFQSKFADVALLNCNDSEVEEAKNKYNVFKLKDIKEGKICNLNSPFNKPDLVVFHAIYYPQYIDLYKQCVKSDIPYIVIPHGSLTKQAQKQKWIKKIPANILLFNGFIRKAKAIQFLTEGEMNKSIKYKSYIIDGNGIELSTTKKIYNNDSTSKSFKIVYVGRYDTYTKGLDLIINATISIKEFCRANNIKVIMYGNDYRGRLQKIRKLINNGDVSDIIEINGPIWDKEKIKKLCESDVFIHPSRTEGQPVGLMEAIDVGIPCIATMETNFGNVIKEYGLGWVPETNSKGIACAIMEAYNSKNSLKDISSKEIKYALDNFEWNNVAKKTINDYRGIVNERKNN